MTRLTTRLAVAAIAAVAPAGLTFAMDMEPPGDPAATGPRLIQAADLPLTIGSEGSWYFAEDIVTTGGGITIAADFVTIDLRGHTFDGLRNRRLRRRDLVVRRRPRRADRHARAHRRAERHRNHAHVDGGRGRRLVRGRPRRRLRPALDGELRHRARRVRGRPRDDDGPRHDRPARAGGRVVLSGARGELQRPGVVRLGRPRAVRTARRRHRELGRRLPLAGAHHAVTVSPGRTTTSERASPATVTA